MYRIRRFNVVKTATVVAVMYMVIIAVFVVPFLVLFAFVGIAGSSQQAQGGVAALLGIGIFAILFYADPRLGLHRDRVRDLQRRRRLDRRHRGTGGARRPAATAAGLDLADSATDQPTTAHRTPERPGGPGRLTATTRAPRLGSCEPAFLSSSPSWPPPAARAAVTLLDDPDEILAAAVTTATAATSVHVDLKAEGTLSVDLFGSGAQGDINLVGTTLAADLDIAGRKTRATFSSPNLMGLAGEAVLVDDTLFLKTTLTGSKFRPSAMSSPPENPLKGLADLIARADLAPVKGADVPCAGGTCYTLSIPLTADDLIALGGGAQLPTGLPIPLPDVSGATVDLTLHVEQTTTRLSGLTAAVDLGDTGKRHARGHVHALERAHADRAAARRPGRGNRIRLGATPRPRMRG